MLRACARALKPGGRLAFFVIRDQPGLSSANRAKAIELDPGYVVTDAAYRDVLAQAGFTDIGEEDVTAGYRDVAARWLTGAVSLEPELRAAMGDAVFEDKQARRRKMIAAMDAGLVGRALFTARVPG